MRGALRIFVICRKRHRRCARGFCGSHPFAKAASFQDELGLCLLLDLFLSGEREGLHAKLDGEIGERVGLGVLVVLLAEAVVGALGGAEFTSFGYEVFVEFGVFEHQFRWFLHFSPLKTDWAAFWAAHGIIVRFFD